MVDVEDDTGVTRRVDAPRPQRVVAAIAGAGMEILKRTTLELAFGAQYLAARTTGDIVTGIELEAAGRNDLARRRLGPGWHDTLDVAIFERPEDLGIGMAGVHRCDIDRPSGCGFDRIEPAVAAVGRHRGIRVGHADLFEPAALPTVTKLFVFGMLDGLDMADGKRVPTDVLADQRSIDMNDFACCDPSPDTGLNGMLKDPTEPLGTPALADPRQ